MNTADQAAMAAWEQYKRRFPHRMTGWDALAGWEQDGWRRVARAAAVPLLAAEREHVRALAIAAGAAFCADCREARERGDATAEHTALHTMQPFSVLLQ